VTTHLPVSEEAFASSTEEKAPTLQDALNGSSGYSTFAGYVITSHIFTRLVKHSQRPMPGDRPEDPESGPFWQRHRELDNILSNAFMFLPQRFRLSRHTGDPTAVQTHLILHGAVICLHSAAREKADKFRLAGIRQASRTRALTAAQEIVNIVKASTNIAAACKSPLMVLSLYLAASVYTAQARDDPEEFRSDNLELLLKCMDGIGYQHTITHAYLIQLLGDIERMGISVSPDILRNFNCAGAHGNYRIPLVARGPTSRHSKVEPPLPGRLPLGAPQGSVQPKCNHFSQACESFMASPPDDEDDNGHASKRARTSARLDIGMSGFPSYFVGQGTQTFVDPAPDMFEYTGTGWAYATKYTNPVITTLPSRMGSPAINTRPMPGFPAMPANLVPDFTGFSMPSSAADPPFPQFQSSNDPGADTAFGFDTLTSTTTNTSQTSNLSVEEIPDVEMFEEFREWGISDPQSIFGMLLDLSGAAGGGEFGTDDTGVGTSQSQSQSQQSSTQNRGGGMNPWSQHN